MELPSCSVPSQSLLSHSSDSSGKGSRVTQSAGWNPPSPPPRQIPQPESSTLSSQESSRGALAQIQAGGTVTAPQISCFTLDHSIPDPAHFLHELQGLTPDQCDPQTCSQTLWKSSSAPSQQPEPPSPASLQAGRFGSVHWEPGEGNPWNAVGDTAVGLSQASWRWKRIHVLSLGLSTIPGGGGGGEG